MNVSANIIRFPAQPLTTPQSPAERSEPAGIVAFSSALSDETADPRAQAHGQLFVAHRIVGRIAEQLEQIASL